MRIGRAPLGVEVIALVLRLPVKRCIGTTTADQKLADSSASPNCGAPTAGSGRHTRNRTSATACFRRRTPAEPQHVPVRSTGTGPPPAPSLAVEVVSPCLALESRTDTALQSRLDLLCPREPWKAQRPSPADQLPENCTLGVRMQSAIAHAVVRDPASDGQGSRPQPPQPHPRALARHPWREAHPGAEGARGAEEGLQRPQARQVESAKARTLRRPLRTASAPSRLRTVTSFPNCSGLSPLNKAIQDGDPTPPRPSTSSPTTSGVRFAQPVPSAPRRHAPQPREITEQRSRVIADRRAPRPGSREICAAGHARHRPPPN